MAAMDKLEKYRNYVQEILEKIGSQKSIPEEIEGEIIIDRQRDHYLLVNVGWQEQKRTYGSSVHIDIKDGKIWVQRDMTDFGIVDRLLEQGIPKEDIVLAFHPPYKRQLLDFAVA